MQPGDILSVNIESLGKGGDGAAEVSGQRLMVPFALPGEEVKAQITEVNPAYASGKALEFTKTSAARAVPPCVHFYQCGGCRLQHMNAELYRNFKHDLFLRALERAGAEPAGQLVEIGPYSRRRATFKVAMENELRLGFYENNSHNVVDIHECHILEPEIFAFSLGLKLSLAKLQEPGKIKEALITKADTGLDVLIYAGYSPAPVDITELKNLAASGAARISWKFGEKLIPVALIRPVLMKFGRVEVELPDEPFLQPTKKGQELITEEVVKALDQAKSIVDLFSGCGTYSFALAEKSRVHAVEMGGDMVRALQKAAAKFKASVTAEQRNLHNNPLNKFELNQYGGAVINPPRTGALNQCKMLAQTKIPKIIMVSCSPDTFSRDAKTLIQGGYKIEKALAIDQFHWSPHLEIVAVLGK